MFCRFLSITLGIICQEVDMNRIVHMVLVIIKLFFHMIRLQKILSLKLIKLKLVLKIIFLKMLRKTVHMVKVNIYLVI